LFDEIPGLESRRDFDFELAGAELLGRHIARSVPAELREKLIRLLEEEADPAGVLRLAGEMVRPDPERARRLLEACLAGLRESGES